MQGQDAGATSAVSIRQSRINAQNRKGCRRFGIFSTDGLVVGAKDDATCSLFASLVQSLHQ